VTPKKILLSWSSGKDSAWALHVLRQDSRIEVAGLFTTVNRQHGRVAMHGVRETLLEAQARAVGLPLQVASLPHPCSNSEYEERVTLALAKVKANGITGLAFGDLFLEDVREYRERQVETLDLEPHFPLWGSDTKSLANEMIDAGTQAFVTCLDPKQIPRALAGHAFDHEFLGELPNTADPCGENGEFHTFVSAGPAFSDTLRVATGETVQREGFVYTDLLPLEGEH